MALADGMGMTGREAAAPGLINGELTEAVRPTFTRGFTMVFGGRAGFSSGGPCNKVGADRASPPLGGATGVVGSAVSKVPLFPVGPRGLDRSMSIYGATLAAAIEAGDRRCTQLFDDNGTTF